MADDITVQISAQIGELQSGLAEATSAIKDMASEVQNSFGKANEAGEEFGGKLGVALDVGLFLEFKEVASMALEGVKSAFEATAGKAEEFGLSNSKLAERLGVSFQEAAALSQALQAVGSSGDEFASMADRMVMRLRQNEQAFNDQKVATRDSNGQLVDGETLMQNAIARMEQLKEGTDQNAFAHEIFGRSVSGVYEIMRVNAEQIQHNKDLMTELGVVTDGRAVDASRNLQAATAETNKMFSDAAVMIGQHLMPVITDLVNSFNNQLKPALIVAENIFLDLISVFDLVITTISEVGAVVGEILNVIGTGLAGVATILADVFLGKWDKVSTDFNDYLGRIKNSFAYTLSSMEEQATGFANRTKGILTGLGEPGGGKGSEKPKGGDSYHDAKQERAVNDEIAASDKALALEQIKMAEDRNNAEYALGQKSLSDHVATAIDLEDKKESIEIAALNKKMARDKGNVLEVQKDADAELMVIAQHDAAVQKIHEQSATQERQIRQQQSAEAISALQSQQQEELAHAQSMVKLHEMTQSQEFALEQNLTTEMYNQELQRLDNDNATLAAGSAAYESYMAKRAKITEKYTADIQKINDKAAEYSMQKWDQLGTSISGSFFGAVNGMILGTKTWQKAVGEIIDGIASAFLKMAENMITEWLATQIKNMVLSQTSAATAAVSQISSAAGVAGANAFASTAAIPIVGPELAPGAAASAVAQTMGFSSLAVAEKGMVLDSDRLVSAHKEEMILPAGISGGLQNMIRNGGGGGDSHLHYSPTINGGSNPSLRDMLARESTSMQGWFKAQMRNGTIKVPH